MILWSAAAGGSARRGSVALRADGWRAAAEGASEVARETVGAHIVQLTVGEETARLFPATDAYGVLDVDATREAAQALVGLIQDEFDGSVGGRTE